MKILLTGASSFTGFWFARELARRGNDVVCPLTKSALDDYASIRRERLELLARERNVQFVFSAGTQSENLRELVAREHFDVFCNHAFATLNHQNPNYKMTDALALAVERLDKLMIALRERGCSACVHSGSYFELGESVRSETGFFTPYALAKSAAWEFVCYWANRLQMRLGKFTIANPVGAYEERGLTIYLAREWLAGRVPEVQTPTHVRDNVPVSALAEKYADFVEKVFTTGTLDAPLRANPSGFVMTNAAWAQFFGEKLFGKYPEFRSRDTDKIVSDEPQFCHGLERDKNFCVPETFWQEYKTFFEKSL